MSHDQLNKLMHDLTRNRETVRRYKAEPAALLKDYDLTEVECDAVATWHLRQLYNLGANPLLLLASSMAMGKNLREYATALRRK